MFSSLKIRSVEFRNRIVVSPMCMYSSKDGFGNDWHLVHLGSRAVGGAGLVMQEATAVSPEGRITPADMGIWKDEHVEFLKRITSFIHAQGSVAGIQLAHAGRKGSHEKPWEGGKALSPSDPEAWQTIAPSAVPFSEQTPSPEALDLEGIKSIIYKFRQAAERALEAGYKVVAIHAAHGYLLNEFLSPLSNKRTDEYGGSLKNRMRIVLEVAEVIRQVWPEEYPLFTRISATDWAEGGWTADDSVALSKELKTRGVDLMDCSSGGLIPGVQIPTEPGYQVQFAEKVKMEADILTGAVGLITDANQAQEILSKGQADLVFLAREFLRDPYFPLNAAKELGQDVKWPVQYERAKVK